MHNAEIGNHERAIGIVFFINRYRILGTRYVLQVKSTERVQSAKITHHANNPRYSWMDCGVPMSIRGPLPSVELRSEPFSNATHCQRAPLGRTESGFAKTCGR